MEVSSEGAVILQHDFLFAKQDREMIWRFALPLLAANEIENGSKGRAHEACGWRLPEICALLELMGE
jgi:hypothetical protein